MVSQLRDLLNIPIYDFPKVIKFEQEKWQLIAKVEGIVLGQCDNGQNEKVVAAFKESLFQRLGHFSTTIELRTRCSCSRLVEHKSRYEVFLVPLRFTPRAFQSVEELTEAASYDKREFVHYGRTGELGLRLYEERE